MNDFIELIGTQRYKLKSKPVDVKNAIFKVANGEETFFGNNRIQCQRGAHRSIVDIFRTVLYYFPLATLEEIKKSLLKVVEENWGIIYCGNVRKFVVYRDWHPELRELYRKNFNKKWIYIYKDKTNDTVFKFLME